jgi:hypothetical protein
MPHDWPFTDDSTPDDDLDDHDPAKVSGFAMSLLQNRDAHRAHDHRCDQDCGCVLICVDADHCRVKDPWTCPSCLDYIDEQQVIALAKKLGRD